MGKSLTGKELGQGITQRKDGRYQARFTNRFGKRQTIYGKTINEIRQKLRTEQYEDEKQINVVSSDMTLDEWFEIWMNTCKNNCRDTTRQTKDSDDFESVSDFKETATLEAWHGNERLQSTGGL